MQYLQLDLKKIWWALFWWAYGVLVVNSYFIYKTECDLKSVRSMVHYELRRKIVIINLDPQKFGGREMFLSTERS